MLILLIVVVSAGMWMRANTPFTQVYTLFRLRLPILFYERHMECMSRIVGCMCVRVFGSIFRSHSCDVLAVLRLFA